MPETIEHSIRFMQDVQRYIGAWYGGTLAHQIISLKLQELRKELNEDIHRNFPIQSKS